MRCPNHLNLRPFALSLFVAGLAGSLPAVDAKGRKGLSRGGKGGKSRKIPKYSGDTIYVKNGGHDTCYKREDVQHLHPIKCPLTNAAIDGIAVGVFVVLVVLIVLLLCRRRKRKEKKAQETKPEGVAAGSDLESAGPPPPMRSASRTASLLAGCANTLRTATSSPFKSAAGPTKKDSQSKYHKLEGTHDEWDTRDERGPLVEEPAKMSENDKESGHSGAATEYYDSGPSGGTVAESYAADSSVSKS